MGLSQRNWRESFYGPKTSSRVRVPRKTGAFRLTRGINEPYANPTRTALESEVQLLLG